jgi:long-chain fatty acid transport protein
MTRGAAIAIVLLAARAEASVPDVFGFGSEATAQGGAVAASASGFEAVHYNPAALSAGRGNSVALGWMGYASQLEIRQGSAAIAEPQGLLLGLTRSIALWGRGNGLRLGAGFYVLPDTIVRVLTTFPDEPQYPWFHNRTQRLVVLPGAALRVTDALSVGVAANVFAGLSGPASATDGPTRAIETSVAEEIFLRTSFVAGARLLVHPEVAWAIAWRHEFFVPYAIQTSNLVGGSSLDIDVEAIGLYTPSELVVGTAWTPPGWTVGLDFTWKAWSGNDRNFVLVESRLPGIGALDPGLPPSPFRDSFDLRLGGERELPLGDGDSAFLRAGAWFEPTPVLPQTGRTNLLDGDHLVGSIGAGVRLADLLEVPLRVDVHGQWHEILPRTYRKRLHARSDDPWALADERPGEGDPGLQVSNPGYPSIEAGGRVLSAGCVVTLEVR